MRELTARRQNIVKLIGLGYSDKEIADVYGIEVCSVKSALWEIWTRYNLPHKRAVLVRRFGLGGDIRM